MTEDPKGKKGGSLLSQHLEILSSDSNALSKETSAELKFAESLDVKPLSLPSQRKSFHWAWATAAALVVAGASWFGIKDQFFPGETYAVRGSTSVTLYWHRADTVHRWVAGDALQNGDKIKVEIASLGDLKAWVAVHTADGKLMSTADDVLASEVRVNPGEPKSFNDSLELAGANERETISLLTCPVNTPSQSAFIMSKFEEAFKSPRTANPARIPVGDCEVQLMTLR